MPQTLTIRQAVQKTGKSDSTIKRWLRDMSDSDERRSKIFPTPEQVAEYKKNNKPFRWEIDEGLVVEELGVQQPGPAEQTVAGQADTGGALTSSAALERMEKEVEFLRSELQRREEANNRRAENQDRRIQEMTQAMLGMSMAIREATLRLQPPKDSAVENDKPKRKWWQRDVLGSFSQGRG